MTATVCGFKRAAMTAQVKICGLTRAADVASAADAGADYLGFIIAAKSSRMVSVDQAQQLIAGHQERAVAVTVDPDDALIAAIQAAGFTHIQLHGSEDLVRTAAIAATGLTVIKAVPVSTRDEVHLATEYSGAADLVLFDAKPPKGHAQKGGHGLSFNWDIVRGAALPKRFALAGGLTPVNVRAAIAATRATLVDVSSGVEASPGIKDAALINAFIKEARG